MHLIVEQNPNCESIEGRVFHERTPPRTVTHVLRSRNGQERWCRVTGLEGDWRECAAVARKVDDSGDGTCYLVTGGAWGLRLNAAEAVEPWSLTSSTQWGEPF